jgi:TPR repeat protein
MMPNHLSRDAHRAIALAVVIGCWAVLGAVAAGASTSAPASGAAEGAQSIPVAQQAKQLVMDGEKYLKGDGVPRDLAKSTALFREAAALGDAKAMARLGEAMVFGRGIRSDREAGLALIREAAAQDSPAGLLALADLQLRGFEGPAARRDAVELLERAAARGAHVALVKLAAIYQAGIVVPRNAAKAAELYRAAIALGRNDALVGLGRGLAEGTLRQQGSPEEGVRLLTLAMEKGNENAVLALSDCYLKGLGVGRDPEKAVQLLTSAWEAGNTRAGLRLLSLYRDGRSNQFKKDRSRADYYAERVIPQLKDTDAEAERLLMAAAGARQARDLTRIAAQFRALPEEYRPTALKRLKNTNATAYVYLVQQRLRELDLYGGAPTGLLSRPTVAAIYKYCVGREEAAVCRKGPMTGPVIEVTANAF